MIHFFYTTVFASDGNIPELNSIFGTDNISLCYSGNTEFFLSVYNFNHLKSILSAVRDDQNKNALQNVTRVNLAVNFSYLNIPELGHFFAQIFDKMPNLSTFDLRARSCFFPVENLYVFFEAFAIHPNLKKLILPLGDRYKSVDLDKVEKLPKSYMIKYLKLIMITNYSNDETTLLCKTAGKLIQKMPSLQELHIDAVGLDYKDVLPIIEALQSLKDFQRFSAEISSGFIKSEKKNADLYSLRKFFKNNLPNARINIKSPEL